MGVYAGFISGASSGTETIQVNVLCGPYATIACVHDNVVKKYLMLLALSNAHAYA